MPVISVNGTFSGRPVWENISVINETAVDRIDFWKVSLLQSEELFTRLYHLLNEAEAEKYKRYFKEDDKKRFLISHSVVKILAGKYLIQDPYEVKIKEGNNKKPFVQNDVRKDFHYNLSHSGNWVLIAVSKKEIGVDIESKEKQFSFDEIILSFFSLEEIEFVKQSHPVAEAFYLLWTRKEALLKATARGITDYLPLVPSLNGIHTVDETILDSSADWEVNSFEVDESHIASFACNPGVKSIRYLDIASVLSGKLNIADA